MADLFIVGRDVRRGDGDEGGSGGRGDRGGDGVSSVLTQQGYDRSWSVSRRRGCGGRKR
jgi:hypothetical protein